MSSLREAFAILREAPDGLDVAEAALLVARCEKPDARVEETLAEVDRLAAHAPLAGATDALAVRAAFLAEYVCAECGFAGSVDYYRRSNSYLDDVVASREGIPITLAVIYLAIGRRMGLDIEGVNFPGHFLIRISERDESVLLDPFSGTLTTLEACQARLRAFQGDEARLGPQHLRTADTRDIVIRMLGNLKGIDLHNGEFGSALALSDRILWLKPDLVTEFRDRAVILEQMGSFDAAAFELERLRPALRDELSRRAIDAKISALRAKG